MFSGAYSIPCYYCKDEEEPVPFYDSKSFAAHILERHRDPVDLILGDSFELNKLFVEDEDDAASASADDASAADASASAGTIACDFCPETFKDLSSSTSHIRISHPDLFYPVSASASASAAAFGSASASAAAFGSDSASASASALASASADAEVSEDTNKEWGDSYLWSFDI